MAESRLKILIVASEAVPFVKEGGLADVAGALPAALSEIGHDVRLVLPLYYQIDPRRYKLKARKKRLSVPMGVIGTVEASVMEGKLPGTQTTVYFIENEYFFGRPGGLYSTADGDGYMDNDNRFTFFSRAAIELCRSLRFRPDCVHVNDWHTAAIPVFLNTAYKDDPVFSSTATLLTIHNMLHQGEFYEGLMDVLGVGWEHFNYLELERDGKTNLLKGGIYHSTLINTVSESYAVEIQTPKFGADLDGVLRDRAADLYGVLNGVDYENWNPETDSHISANYSIDNLAGKALCKADLQKVFGLPQRPDVPVIGLVTRLVKQKGIDILAEAIYGILELDVQVVLLGTGEVWAHFFFGDIPNLHKDKFGCYIGYSNTLAHKIEAGSDFFLMPSRFEPCGLNQMYSMRYGTLPIVRAIGGLNDTVENLSELDNTGTGFKFYDLTADALINTVKWAVYTYYNRKDLMECLIQRAMSKRFTWAAAARQYEGLYRRAIEKKNHEG
ncbi:glycogen synthase GlgA [Candidatus Magnetominusculus dajiuhuensis]|uniref:glycogen synthase GlgA n=1 Tax=Candidatus Magnetominusculus dajiuhuensis TaxID=3137712 RepID=UPI003B43AC6A